MEKRGRWDMLPVLWRIFRLARSFRPAIIHGYLPPANIAALIVGRAVKAKVLWGIRASRLESSEYDWLNAVSLRVASILSRFPDLIIANSDAGKEDHVAGGFPISRVVVVPNGVDTVRFAPQPEWRSDTRRQWNLEPDAFVIGHVCRIDPMKDHESFLRAAAQIRLWADQSDAEGKLRRVRFVCVGRGDSQATAKLQTLAQTLGVHELVRWITHEGRMERAYSAFDLLASTSAFGEGFPNVVVEAMACGVPCVVTDVGDSAKVVGDVGIVVPPRDFQATAIGWNEIAGLSASEYAALCVQARNRAVSHFAIQRMVLSTETLLDDLLAERGPAAGLVQ
jgi:glycosyltransferase involved in cell wall biosynthesis